MMHNNSKPSFLALFGFGSAVALFVLMATLFYVLFVAQNGSFGGEIESRIYGLLEITFVQATLSTLLSLLVGFLIAWSLAHQPNFMGRGVLIALFSSSLVLPVLVVVFGLIGVFGRSGWIHKISSYLFSNPWDISIYGLGGILLGHVYLNASFSSRGFLHALESIPTERYRVAKSLGFGVWRRFIYVEWPAVRSTMLGVGSTIFLLCFTSFAVVLLLGGSPKYNTLEVAIYEAVRLDFDIAMAVKLASVQLVISAFFVIFSSGFRESVLNLTNSAKGKIYGEKRFVSVVQIVSIWSFALFFILPLLSIVVDGLSADLMNIFSREVFLESLRTSLLFALVSSVITVMMTVALSSAMRYLVSEQGLGERWYAKFLRAVVSFLSNIYLAIPSLVLGLGFFLFSIRFESGLFSWASIALVVANVLMSLPFAVAMVAPMMEKSAKRYDKLSVSLGLSSMQRWVYVDYPYLAHTLGYVMALSFCFSLGDLGIISLFGSDEFMTLPWYLYQLMGSYRSTDASGVALVLLVLVFGAFMILPKVFGGKSAKSI